MDPAAQALPAACLVELERYLNRMRTMIELAEELGVSVDYIRALKRQGLRFPGGKCSIRAAKAFIAEVEKLEI